MDTVQTCLCDTQFKVCPVKISLKGNSSIFEPVTFINPFWHVNDSYLHSSSSPEEELVSVWAKSWIYVILNDSFLYIFNLSQEPFKYVQWSRKNPRIPPYCVLFHTQTGLSDTGASRFLTTVNNETSVFDYFDFDALVPALLLIPSVYGSDIGVLGFYHVLHRQRGHGNHLSSDSDCFSVLLGASLKYFCTDILI